MFNKMRAQSNYDLGKKQITCLFDQINIMFAPDKYVYQTIVYGT